jgi:U4/U6.U5 tri-snRNP component SNU23
MKQRDAPLELDKNLGKTMVVQNTSGRGPGVPGFYCDACNRTYKDSNAYLDHINGRARELLSLLTSQIDTLSITIAPTDRSTRPRSNDKDITILGRASPRTDTNAS